MPGFLSPTQQKHHCGFLCSDDLAQNTKKVLTSLMKTDDLVYLFDKKQIKALYRILSEYHIYPICPLCGKPIKTYANNKHPGEFTWDHVVPKSLGGGNELCNLQPTHKKCNNRKGNDMSYHVHYDITYVIVNINCGADVSGHIVHRRKDNLHKKDYWRQTRNGRSR